MAPLFVLLMHLHKLLVLDGYCWYKPEFCTTGSERQHRTDSVSQSFKVALIKPPIKKPNQDTSDLSNYRPVSNCLFLSRILEGIAARPFTQQKSAHGVSVRFINNQSCETASLKVSNYLVMASDSVLLSFGSQLITVSYSED